MIDTIKFKIPISYDQFKKYRQASEETLRFSHPSKTTSFRYWKAEKTLGSYNKDINIFISDSKPDELRLELSIPKYHYGHNIFLVYNSQLPEIVQDLWVNLTDTFGSFPQPFTWKIQRLDLCYSWKYRSQDQARQVIDVIRSFDYPRKKVHRYDTSVMYLGSSYTVKWYLKQPEFHKHDFKTMVKRNLEHAYKVLGFSDGVLRFEVTLRRSSFKTHFGTKDLKLRDIYKTDLTKKLKYFFDKALEFNSNDFMNSTQVFQKLKNKYRNDKAVRLFTFYVTANSENFQDKQNIYNTLSRSQIYRNKKALEKAGVGLLTTTTNPNFSLNLPSNYATSQDPAS